MSAFATLRAPVVVKTGKASAFARGSSAALPVRARSPSSRRRYPSGLFSDARWFVLSRRRARRVASRRPTIARRPRAVAPPPSPSPARTPSPSPSPTRTDPSIPDLASLHLSLSLSLSRPQASRASPSVLRASSVLLPARRGRALSLTTKARAAGEGKDGKSVTGRKPNPEFAGEDGKLWVCQGCGYIYDGSLGKWKEESRCPACGERRFALKTRGEMQIAIGSIIGVTVLVAALYALVKLA